MLSKKLIDAINEQINYELASGYLYLSMAAYAVDKNYTGSALFLKKQAHEETEHALKFIHFMEEMNARVVLKGISDPQVEFEGFKDLFEKSLKHEKSVTARIYKMMDVAREEGQYAATNLLRWFIDEQVEEESQLAAILGRLSLTDNSPIAIMMMDEKLGSR